MSKVLNNLIEIVHIVLDDSDVFDKASVLNGTPDDDNIKSNINLYWTILLLTVREIQSLYYLENEKL